MRSPVMMRRVRVTVASTVNGPNTTSGNQSGHRPARHPTTPNAAARKPSGMDPASPMNTRAGGKLDNRNAAAAPQTASAAAASNGCVPAAATAYAPNPINAMPPASPSEPSMKLNKLVIQATVIASANTNTSGSSGRSSQTNASAQAR